MNEIKTDLSVKPDKALAEKISEELEKKETEESKAAVLAELGETNGN